MDKNKYELIKEKWSKHIQDNEFNDTLTVEYHLIYKELCKKNWKECLAPTTKDETINNLYFTGATKRFFAEICGNDVIEDIVEKIKEEKEKYRG